MSRPNRGERPTQKGRPKRRAAATHLFKYQLARNPSKAEEEALKKALQESLEEQKGASPQALTTTNKSMIRKNNRVVNSSTNSSDVSKTSNNSSSTSNNSRESVNGTSRRRAKPEIVAPDSCLPTNKRAKLTANGHKHIKISTNSEADCDKNSSVLSESPPPLLNKAIRTYSRNHQVNGHHDLGKQKGSPNTGPISSTPISKMQVSPDQMLARGSMKSSDKDIHKSTPNSTQTSAPSVTTICNIQKDACDKDDTGPISTNGPVDKPKIPTTKPDEDSHPKLKRESKNYAYAKMTALKVNTYASPYTYLKPANVKKTSPTGILDSHINKDSIKTYSRLKKSNLGMDSTARVAKTSKKSPSPNLPREQNLLNTGKSSSKVTPKQVASKGLENDNSSNTIDLSKITQAGVNVTKKCVAPGSWSLLGVPEEKVMYLRDDEPPRRLICYPAIKHVEGDVIQVRDSVLLRSETTDLPYIAKVYAFWEDPETGGVMMSLYWYYRPEHIEEGRKPHHLPDEIFASRHRDVDSVECIEDKCYVLTFNEYCRYRKRAKMEQVGTTWSLADVTIPVSNECYPRRNRIPDMDVNPELVFCCRQIYDSRMNRLIKNPLINPKYGHI